ncbi:hypothetical protein JZO66_02855 [Enterococcus sp. DIV0242_7C1]|uniref:Uncharacterized protein n=1 Tax=Candidatus Enterococcus dunnyi TaxID=1834192 RepID=A0AAQ3W1P2_9ENTE|nr:hypothetical protein [Enterococcus sp. DIV0242_7C1]MBO0469473.1 hypothetical protein [Enterococcus sp. DIV0242_7C1]
MILRIANDNDLKEIIDFVSELRKKNGRILNFLADYKDELERQRIANPRYLRTLLFDYNSRVLLIKDDKNILAVYVLYTPSKISKTTTLELIHYYGNQVDIALSENVLIEQFQKQYNKIKLTLTEEADELGMQFGFGIKETVKYLSGNDYIYSLNLEES